MTDKEIFDKQVKFAKENGIWKDIIIMNGEIAVYRGIDHRLMNRMIDIDPKQAKKLGHIEPKKPNIPQ
jgi:hypothetical protein